MTVPSHPASLDASSCCSPMCPLGSLGRTATEGLENLKQGSQLKLSFQERGHLLLKGWAPPPAQRTQCACARMCALGLSQAKCLSFPYHMVTLGLTTWRGLPLHGSLFFSRPLLEPSGENSNMGTSFFFFFPVGQAYSFQSAMTGWLQK